MARDRHRRYRADSSTLVPSAASLAAAVGMTAAELRGRDRGARISEARQIGMWLARRRLGLTYPQIGRLLDRHHTTVLWGVRTIEERRRSDVRLAAFLWALTALPEPRDLASEGEEAPA